MSQEKQILRLYIAGHTPRSEKVEQNVKNLCKQYFGDQHELTVINVLERPELVEGENILVTPTLVHVLPPPKRTILGNLSDTGNLTEFFENF